MEPRTDIDALRAGIDDRQIVFCIVLFHEYPSITNSTGRGLGFDHTPKRGHQGATTHGSAASPGSGFLTGTQPPKSKRPLSGEISVVDVFLMPWATEYRGGGFLECPFRARAG